MTEALRCLHCGQTKAQIKANQTVCGIEGGYEYVELIEEWPRHRWADWRDAELGRMRVKPEAYEKHRRTQITQFEWMACEDTVRGHAAASKDEPDWGVRAGDCILCGKRGVWPKLTL